MPSYQRSHVLPYTARQVYALVADVKRYPEFIPWCQQAIIHSEDEHQMCADLIVGEGVFQGRFQSLVSFSPFEKICVSYQDGPLKYLKNEWIFCPLKSDKEDSENCQVNFFIDFEFKNALFEMMMKGIFEGITNKMLEAFETRAHALYGKQP